MRETVTDKQALTVPAVNTQTTNQITNITQGTRPKKQSRPHVYELDPLRATTALVVVAVHVLAFTAALNHTSLGLQIQNAVVTSIHYTREMFMFVTAFALTYVYYGKPFSALTFWKKRALGVLLPYCVWSIIYVWASNTQHSFGSFVTTSLMDILTGRASYQLYYILLSLQFYLLLPLFLPLIGFLKKYPWRTLLVSFVLELVFLYADYHLIQRGLAPNTPFWQFIGQFQDSIAFTYQFYFILGGLVAIYLPQVLAFLKRYGWWTLAALVVATTALWVHFFIQVDVYREPIGYAVSVLQPGMTFYSLAVIACFFWLAYRWARTTRPDGKPKGHRIWGTLSDASFGVYLVHALILNWLLQHMVPGMPPTWPVALRVFLTWFITAGGAALASIIIMNIPVVSRLVGRSRPLPRGILRLRWSAHSMTNSGNEKYVQQTRDA